MGVVNDGQGDTSLLSGHYKTLLQTPTLRVCAWTIYYAAPFSPGSMVSVISQDKQRQSAADSEAKDTDGRTGGSVPCRGMGPTTSGQRSLVTRL